ncbi:MAG: glycosyltransferase [Opitutales bacterium]
MGGTERQSLQIARDATRDGHAVTLLLFRPGGPLEGQLEGAPFAVEVLQRYDTRVSLYAPRLIAAIERIRPEVILCMGRTANCYAGFVQARFPHRAVVGTLRTGKCLFPLQLWALAQVRGIIANSDWWRWRLRSWGVPVEGLAVIQNALLGGTAARCAEQRKKKRAEAGLSAETVVLLKVAGFRAGKRHSGLLRLLAPLAHHSDLPPWELWLVGDGRERRRCERLAARLGLNGHIRFLGAQTDPRPFYAAADIAVSASTEDSLPNFLIEAQSMGLPLVAIDFRGVREACVPGYSGEVVGRRDGVGFAAAVARLMRDETLREEMGRHGREHAVRRFAPSTQARRMLDALVEMTAHEHI